MTLPRNKWSKITKGADEEHQLTARRIKQRHRGAEGSLSVRETSYIPSRDLLDHLRGKHTGKDQLIFPWADCYRSWNIFNYTCRIILCCYRVNTSSYLVITLHFLSALQENLLPVWQQGEVTYDRIDSISTIMLGYVFLLHRWEKPKPSTGRAWSNKTKTRFIVTEKCTSSFWSGSGVTGENCLLRPQNFERERKQPGSPRTEWGTASPEIPSSIPRTAAQQRWIHLRPYTHFSKSLRSAIRREYE